MSDQGNAQLRLTDGDLIVELTDERDVQVIAGMLMAGAAALREYSIRSTAAVEINSRKRDAELAERVAAELGSWVQDRIEARRPKTKAARRRLGA